MHRQQPRRPVAQPVSMYVSNPTNYRIGTHHLSQRQLHEGPEAPTESVVVNRVYSPRATASAAVS